MSDAPAGAGPTSPRRGEGSGGASVSEELARRLADASGGSARVILLYGSHLLGTSPDRHSARDFVVVVDDYMRFYRVLHDAGELSRPPRIMTLMAGVLPPNVIAFTPDDGRAGIAKCLVVSHADLERALGPRPPDHFLLGRLVQRVGLLWSADSGEAARVQASLEGAREGVLEWMAPYLDGPFGARELGRRMLEVCYRGELRPEARDRAARIYEAQADYFEAALGPVLERAVVRGTLVRRGGHYELARPASRASVARWRWHFTRSKTRATARWLKHTVTFSNWLPYVVRKVERHTGRSIQLTPLERRLPLVFLWPRAVRILLSRPGKAKR